MGKIFSALLIRAYRKREAHKYRHYWKMSQNSNDKETTRVKLYGMRSHSLSDTRERKRDKRYKDASGAL